MSVDTRTIGPRTLATINVISAWVVNTFYNYLHQQAVNLHTHGRVTNITDGYKFIVRQYLDSFNDSDGYKRNLLGLHRYYMDNTRHSSIPFDAWIKDILSHFVPTDYFPIMSNTQQDSTLRSILLNAIIQFSRDVVCTQTLDTLITNHSHPSLVPIMKKSMSSALLFERQKLFQALFKSSTGGSQSKPMDMMRDELTKLVEENVILKHKNKKAVDSLKNALFKMKERDAAIHELNVQLLQLKNKFKNVKRHKPVSPPASPTVTFIKSVETHTGLNVNDIKDAADDNHNEKPFKSYDDNDDLSIKAPNSDNIENDQLNLNYDDSNVVALNMAEFLESCN